MDHKPDPRAPHVALTQTRVCAVVVSYNGRRWLEACLDSLRLSSVRVDVVVVDNASEDGTLDSAVRLPGVAYLSQETNLGFGAASNLGIRFALDRGADYILLLNQDARVLPDTVAELVRCATAYPEYGIQSPVHLDGSGERLDPSFLEYVARGAPDFYSDLFRGELEAIYPVAFVNAAAWLITHSCLEGIGGFDPLFHMYEEDMDYCRRAAFHGFRIGIVPTARVLHSRGKHEVVYRSPWHRRLSNLRTASERARNRSILCLKEPSASFTRQFALMIRDLIADSLHDIITLNLHGAAWRSIGLVRVIAALPTIRRHRAVSLAAGSHWL
jgi:GT2 family glycosyltransferase